MKPSYSNAFALSLLLLVSLNSFAESASHDEADTGIKPIEPLDKIDEKTADQEQLEVAEPATNNATGSNQAGQVTELDTVTVTSTLDDGEKSYKAHYSTSSTRTDTPIKETPQSVQVITRKLLDDQQTVTVSEALRNVSGVMPNNVLFTPAAENTRIRGFAAEQLLDGFTQYYNPGDRESTINLDRIEVLKGSNAVLYSGGSGAPVGGVVNLVTKQPMPTAFRQLGMRLGSFDFYQPFVDLNQPVTENVMARFTGEYTNSGSFLDNINTERYNVNPVITITNNDTTNFTLQGRVAGWRQREYQGLPATGTVFGDVKVANPERFIGPEDIPYSHSNFSGVWGIFDHWFNDTWSVNVKARYAESEFKEVAQTLVGRDALRNPDGSIDLTGGVLSYVADIPIRSTEQIPLGFGLTNTLLFQQQQEVSVLANALAEFDYGITKNKWLIGADYSKYDDSGSLNSELTGIGRLVDLSKNDQVFPEYRKPAEIPVSAENITYGGYTQIQSTIYDRLHVLFSVRAGTVEIDYVDQGIVRYNGTTSETRILPRAGAVFDITKELSLFANYSEGMRGQPFTRFINSQPRAALSDSLEAGIKIDIAQRLTGQLAVYEINRSNVAVPSFTNAFGSLAAGKQRSRGFESDWVYSPIDGLSLLSSYAFTNAEFTEDAGNDIPKGSKLFGVPEHSTRFWVNYDFQQPVLKGLSAGIGMYWQSAAYLSNKNFFKSDSFYTMDASVAYQLNNYSLAVSIKNLTDEQFFQSYGYLGGRVAPAQGVSAYATITANF